jgi:hypothetical protein
VNLYFGVPWDAPLLDDARQVPTPVGAVCLECVDPIEDGDRGLLMALMVAAPGESINGSRGWNAGPVHLECHLRSTMSHVVRQCRCFVPDRSLRDEARATLVAVNEWRAEIQLGPL